MGTPSVGAKFQPGSSATLNLNRFSHTQDDSITEVHGGRTLVNPAGLTTKSKSGFDRRRASLDRIRPATTPAEPPPPYRRNEDEAYKGDGNYMTPDGRNKYATDNVTRLEFMNRNKITQKLANSEEAGLVKKALPIFVADLSQTMTSRVKPGYYNTAQRIWNKFKKPRTRQEEQTKRVLGRMDIVEGLCENEPELYTTRQFQTGYERLAALKGDTVNSKSPEVMTILTSPANSGTNLSGLIRQVKADHAVDVGDLSPIVVYLSTDGDSTDALDVKRTSLWGFDRRRVGNRSKTNCGA